MADQDQKKDQQPEQPNKKPEMSQNNNDVVMLMIKASSKIYKLKSYDKTINNLIHGWPQKKAIKKKLHNMKIYQTWEYDELPPR